MVELIDTMSNHQMEAAPYDFGSGQSNFPAYMTLPPKRIAVLGLALCFLAGRAGAQETVPAPGAAAADSAVELRRPVSPMGAFWRSLLVPGWGQAKLNRKLTGGLFIAFEGLALGMVIKSSHQLSYMERTGDPNAEAKKGEREDWITLLVFNHLMSGPEAFVSAHLWDFPGDLELRATPSGGHAATLSFSF